MKTREQLEKMFDENFASSIDNEYYTQHLNFIKEFIFETIMPEVLNSVIPNYVDTNTKDELLNDMRWWHNNCIDEIKQKAKELYWITL